MEFRWASNLQEGIPQHALWREGEEPPHTANAMRSESVRAGILVVLLLASVLTLPPVAATAGAAGLATTESTSNTTMTVNDSTVDWSVTVEELASGTANYSLRYGLQSVEGNMLNETVLPNQTLGSGASRVYNLTLNDVPFGLTTLYVSLEGDVGANTSTHLSAFTRPLQRLRPLDVGLGSPTIAGLSWNGSETGNTSVHDGDGVRFLVPIINDGDVDWNGSLHVSTTQMNTTLFHNLSNISVPAMSSIVQTVDRTETVAEGNLSWSLRLLGDIGEDESEREREGILTVAPPPLPLLNGLFDEVDQATLVAGDPVSLMLTVWNNGTAAFNGHLVCGDGNQTLHNETLSLAQGQHVEVNLSVLARPMSLSCSHAGPRTEAGDAWPAVKVFDVESATFTIAGTTSLSLEGGPWHQGDAMGAHLLVRNTGDRQGRLRLVLTDGSIETTGEWATLEAGAAGEVKVEHLHATTGVRAMTWRLDSDDGGFEGVSSGALTLTVSPPQSIGIGIVGVETTNGRTVLTVSTQLEDGPDRTALLQVGVDAGDGPTYVLEQQRLFEPGYLVHEFDLGQAIGDRAVVRITPVGWSIGPGPLTVSTTLPDETTTYRLTLNPVVSPIRPVVGDEVSLELQFEQTGALQAATGTVRLLDAYGALLAEEPVDAWSGSISTQRIMVDWPSGTNVLIHAVWDVDGQRIDAQATYLAGSPPEEPSAGLPWASILWGAVLGGVIIAVARVMTNRPDRTTKPPSLDASPKQEEDVKVEVACPSCDRRLRLPATYEGSVGCPDCKHRFDASAALAAVSKPAISSAPEKITVSCPDCSQQLRVPSNHEGSVRCPACTKVFKADLP